MTPKDMVLRSIRGPVDGYGVNVDADGKIETTNLGRGAVIETEDDEQAAYDRRRTPHPRR